MELRLRRTEKADGWTLGELWSGGAVVCRTLEPCDRGLRSDMAASEIASRKKRGATAIPSGEYAVRLDVESVRFSGSAFMREVCGGKVPRLDGVPGFEGVLIHTGNTAADTAGCIIVGEAAADGVVTGSRAAFRRLYGQLRGADGGVRIRVE